MSDISHLPSGMGAMVMPETARGRPGVVVRPLAPPDADACDAIVRGLPDFFGHAGGIAACARATREGAGLVAVEAGQIVGFASWTVRTAATAEITWRAVARDRRGHGIGTAIVDALVAELRGRDLALALVMTSAGSKGAPGGADPYAATRHFWRARGFLPLTELDLWATDRALLLVRPLAS